MEPIAAVKSCLRKYATFSGRAPRSEYWFFILLTSIASYIASIITSIVALMLGMSSNLFPTAAGQTPHFSPDALYLQMPSMLLALALLIPSIAAGVRRLHDVNRSGWWWWLSFVPVVGVLWLLVWQCSSGTKGDNRFGPNPLPPLAPGQVAMIEPTDAVKNCLRNYVGFRGRASRAEFWFFYLFHAVVASLVMFVMMIAIFVTLAAEGAFHKGAHVDPTPIYVIAGLAAIPFLALFLPSVSIAVRRLHDTGRSGWNWWWYGVPLVGFVLTLVWNCERGALGPNRYGPDPLAPATNWPIAQG